MQTTGVEESYKYLDLSPSKALDCAIALAGHGTLYSVTSDTYTIPSSGGDLNTGNGFTAVKRYADFPRIGASKLKGEYPEEGGFSIGECEVEFQDKRTDAHATEREFTDLASRWAYLEGNKTGTKTQLSADITASATTINVDSTTGIVAGDVIHIGRESILIGTVASGTQFTGCTRGYRLTLAVPHLDNVKVYAYLPSLKGRQLFIYKGYQGLILSSWIKGWGGIIDGVNHSAAKLSIHAMATTWEMHGGRARKNGLSVANKPDKFGGVGTNLRKIVRLSKIDDSFNDGHLALVGATDSLSGDYEVSFHVPEISAPTGLGDGHFALNGGEQWLGICNPLVHDAQGNSITVTAKVVTFPAGVSYEDPVDAGQRIDLGWCNATFTATAAPGGPDLDPIELILKFMTSALGDDTNGSYDDFKRGIGLAIPEALIDTASFSDIRAQNDYDTGMAVFFLFSKAEGAKDFFDEQLCKPFGWYLATDNAGKIKLVRPKNPVRLYFSKANNDFAITTSAEPLKTRHFYLPAGVYTPTQVASKLQTGLNQVTPGGFTVSWSSSTGFFTISKASGNFTFSASDTWATIGHTTASADTSKVGTKVGLFTDSTGGFLTIDENDLKGIQMVDTLPNRIAEVWYHCNYDWSTEEFTTIKIFTDAEVANLDGEVEPYEIESKGLLRAFTASGDKGRGYFSSVKIQPTNGCEGTVKEVSSSYGLDFSDSFVTLFCAHMFDRYRGQPMRFKCKLPWKYNRVEIGDNVSISYAIDGVLADYELDAGTISGRIFEVISIKPDFAGGMIDVELLGHRAGG